MNISELQELWRLIRDCPIQIHVFHHNKGETEALTEIREQLKELLLLHRGEKQLKTAGDKLQAKTDALSEVLPDPNKKE